MARVAVRERRPTLATVAAAAGVSVATVSKVLNGRSDVAADTRALVQDALRRHEYVAPTPRRKDRPATSVCEVALDGDLHAYSCEIVQGVVDAGRELGVDVVLATRAGGPRRVVPPRPADWAQSLVAAGRRAVIAVTSELTAEHVSALDRVGVLLVVVDPLNLPAVRVTSIGSTNFAGGLEATRHLLALGHRRIGFVGGPTTAACNLARLHGFRAALESAGELVPDGLVTQGRFTYDDGAEAAATLLDSADRPTAIVAASDEMALGVLAAAGERGLRVPADLSVVGFDDTHLARTASPPLTTIRQPLWEMGRVALRTALRLADGEAVESHHVELATELVVRRSTAPVPSSTTQVRRPGRDASPRTPRQPGSVGRA